MNTAEYIFGDENTEQKIYIGSADYMSRNTVRRVEVATPVENDKLKQRLWEMFRTLMKDNVKARIMLNDGNYTHIVSKEEEAVNAQEFFYEQAYRNLEIKQKRQQQLRINLESSIRKKSKNINKKRKNS